MGTYSMNAPYWKWGGRYGASFVDEYRQDDTSNATYGTLDSFRSRKQAEKVAAALNAAYERGRRDAKADMIADRVRGS